MITEFAMAGGLLYGFNKLKDRDVKNTFNKINDENNLGYSLVEINKLDVGHSLIVSLNGQGYKDLVKAKDLLESGYGATIDIKQNDNIKTATIYVITEKLTDTYKFVPIKVKPYELYLGKTHTMKDVIISMKEFPHVLYSGINSSGKTYCVITAIVNLIQFNSKRDVEIFLAQISAKKDLRKFKDLEHCRGYAETLEDAYDMFNYIYHSMLKRISIFNSVKNDFIDDIYEWNSKFPNRKMRITILAMDEFTAYMPDSLDSKTDAELKNRCLDLLIKIIQQSRCCGIYVMASLQRPDKESLPPRLKAQFNCKVAFKQSNIASSLTVIDSDQAYYLKPKREAIVQADEEYLMKTLYLDNAMIKELLKDKLDFDHTNYCKQANVRIPVPAKKSKSKVKVKSDDNKKR